MARGFMYLVAVMDWHSRYVFSWRLCNTLEADFCIEALQEALSTERPEIFNTNQGSQFTSEEFTGMLEQHDVRISMNGNGKLQRQPVHSTAAAHGVKYEEVYLKAYRDGGEAKAALTDYFRSYNNQRPHQGLGYRTPAAVCNSGCQGNPASGQTADNNPGKTAGLHLNPVPVLS